MPLLFIGTGIVLLLTGLQGNASDLYKALKNDFTGKNNFIYWMLSILVLGSLGYIKPLQPLSRLFVALVLVVLLLDNKGFFAQLQAFVNTGAAATPTNSSTTTGAATATPATLGGS